MSAALTLTVFGLGGLVAVPAVRATVGECVTGYDSKGRAGVYGAVLEIPFENYAGSPYVESELSSLPKSRALAATFYEGFAAAIVLGTADVDYENPTLSEAHYPAVSGAQDAEPQEPPPGLVLDANAKERLVEAYSSFPGGEIPGLGQFGSAYAQSTATFDGEAVRGVDQVWTYDLRLGDAHVNQIRSVVAYATDGTAEGTTVSWEIEFGGIRQAGSPEGRLSGDGVVIQGGDPQPGSEPRTSFDEAVAELSAQLDAAGVGHRGRRRPGTGRRHRQAARRPGSRRPSEGVPPGNRIRGGDPGGTARRQADPRSRLAGRPDRGLGVVPSGAAGVHRGCTHSIAAAMVPFGGASGRRGEMLLRFGRR
ncbi:MAG: hypothetical protein KY395_05990, partial [Actinobacteria bacterium]|nr:hypothetical protein [Actinomycetota bacterium]